MNPSDSLRRLRQKGENADEQKVNFLELRNVGYFPNYANISKHQNYYFEGGFTMNNNSKNLLSLVIGTFFLIIIFANCVAAWAENSSQVVIKQSADQTSKPVVRPSRKHTDTKYDVKVETVKIIAPQKQTQAPDRSKGRHGESVSPLNDKIKIEIGPVKKISPVIQGNLKTRDDVKSRHQGAVQEGKEISGNIKIEPISKPKDGVSRERKRGNLEESEQRDNIKKKVSPAMPIDEPEKGNKKYEIQISPIKEIGTEDTQKIQPSLRERISVTNIQSWKLNESGNKTNEATTENMRVIEEINQPPTDIELK